MMSRVAPGIIRDHGSPQTGVKIGSFAPKITLTGPHPRLNASNAGPWRAAAAASGSANGMHHAKRRAPALARGLPVTGASHARFNAAGSAMGRMAERRTIAPHGRSWRVHASQSGLVAASRQP
jgi:hypothetical protein